jgi:hypothetical protein
MSGLTAQDVIDQLAELLQRSVVIDDPAVRLLYASRHYGDEDKVRTHAVLQRQATSAAVGHVLAQGVAGWTTPGVIPPNESIEMLARVCYPIRWRGDLLGLLLVVDAAGSITTSELSAISAAGEELAPMLAGERMHDDASARRSTAVGDLITGSEPTRRAALRVLESDLDTADFEHVRVVSVRVRDAAGASDSHIATALGLALQTAGTIPGSPTMLTTVQGHQGSVVLGLPRRAVSERQAVDLGARLVAKVDEVAAGRFSCAAGVGAETTGLDRAWASYDQSVLACDAAGDRGISVQLWSTLGPMAILLHLPHGRLPIEALPAEMQRVLAADPDGRLMETLRAFLEHAGAIPATAEALHIHRTTLYYRLEKLSTGAQIDLDSGDTRLALHLSLKLLDRPGILRQ